MPKTSARHGACQVINCAAMAGDKPQFLDSLKAVSDLAAELKRSGVRLVTTNGCFDVLHWGHLQYLAEARALGDRLMVLVNSDRSVQVLKGKSRPVFPEEVRVNQLLALRAVDYVYVFDELTPCPTLEAVRPQLHVKGGDYKAEDLPETDVVERHGGEVRVLSLVDGYSTSRTLELLAGKKTHPEGQVKHVHLGREVDRELDL